MFSSVLYLLLLSTLVSFQEPAEGAPEGSGTRGLTQAEEAAMRTAFQTYDQNRNGEIDKQELKSVLLALGDVKENVPDKYINYVMSKVDKDNSGTINYEEFCDIMKTTAPGNQLSPDELFDIFGDSKDGLISAAELSILTMFDNEVVKSAFQEIDIDKDGKLNRNEFKTLLKSIGHSSKK